MIDQKYYQIWRRKGHIDILKDVVNVDIEFIKNLCNGFNHLYSTTPDVALADFREAQWRLREDFTLLSIFTGDCFLRMNRIDSALVYLQQALLLDTLCWEARIDLIEIANKVGDNTTAMKQIQYLERSSPWMFDKSYQPNEHFRADEPY
jgi:two-component SAPR family response regulator